MKQLKQKNKFKNKMMNDWKSLRLLLLVAIEPREAFVLTRPTTPTQRSLRWQPSPSTSSSLVHVNNNKFRPITTQRWSSNGPDLFLDNEDDNEGEEDDEDDNSDVDDEEEDDPYTNVASSEFLDQKDPENPKYMVRRGDFLSSKPSSKSSSSSSSPTTSVDWGGALGRLRERVQDVESGDSKNPSKALFRYMSTPSPNQAIGSFVSQANPQVIEAMSGAVSSLLGGLSNPQSGVEMIVKASGEKIGSLCFQLQMTGYMFRNAEYAMALKDLMDISASATMQDYKDAFDGLDRDGSGYIEASDIKGLLDTVYDGQAPAFEIDTFLKFFDQDQDGRVSWEEFQRGLGAVMVQHAEKKSRLQKLLSSSSSLSERRNGYNKDDEDDDDEIPQVQPNVSGTIEIELEDGKTVQVDAAEYMKSLKEEARMLKEELQKEKLGGRANSKQQVSDFLSRDTADAQNTKSSDTFGGITNYIASRQGDIKALTEGISPEIVETMKLLVDYVLEGGASGKGRKMPKKEEISMEIPASALQQLALWQLILGYQLREAEAKGDYLKLLE